MTSDDQFVCAECVNDYAVQAFIGRCLEAGECSYCGKTDEDNPIAAPFGAVARFIEKGLQREYEDPANSVGYESAEGGYLLPTMDTRELLWEVGLDGNQNFIDDLCHTINDHDWVHVDPYGLPDDEQLAYTWEQFSAQVKHQTRFVFFKVSTQKPHSFEPEPFEILEQVGRLVDLLGLVKELPAGTRIIRARQSSNERVPAVAADIGPPDKDRASQSRMSPAGIPMFYGADSEETAFAEIFEAALLRPMITFGFFEALRPLRLLDLTNIPKVPSIFDAKAFHTRMGLSFMHKFEEDVTQSVPRDEGIHYRYVPTQVVAEYFRHVFEAPAGQRLDGIMFKSSKHAGGICYSLFIDGDACCDPPPQPGRTLMLASLRRLSVEPPLPPGTQPVNSSSMTTVPVLSADEIQEDRPMPSRNHARVAHNLSLALGPLRPRLETYQQLSLDLAGWPTIPDLCCYPTGRLAADWTSDEDAVAVPPALVIEILSPKQNLQPLVDKVRQYLERGVQSCWIVIPTAEAVMVFPASGGSRRFIEGDVVDTTLDLHVPVSAIFA